jgi:hypothetical protein
MYTAYVLTDESRNALLERFPPKYSKVIAHHVTVEFGVPEDTELPENAQLKVIGEADSGDGLQALVVSVNGEYRRSDGKIYHITWSLEPDSYKPVDSNDLVVDYNNRWKVILPVAFEAEPAILD